MPVPCVCLTCGASFAAKPAEIRKGKGKYCSSACFHQREQLPDPARLASRVCCTCQATFTIYATNKNHRKRKYCSRKCSHQPKTPSVACVCLACKKPFTVSAANNRRGKNQYCCLQCWNQTPHQRTSLADRFWLYVLKSEEGCWLWQGGLSNKGYGQLSLPGKGNGTILAHRLSYELAYGMILPTVFCLHRCDTPACVNPAHLYLGTQSDNGRDVSERKRTGYHRHPESYPVGEKVWSSRLTEDQIREIRRLHDIEKWSQGRIGRYIGIAQSSISKIVLRKGWKHVE